MVVSQWVTTNLDVKLQWTLAYANSAVHRNTFAVDIHELGNRLQNGCIGLRSTLAVGTGCNRLAAGIIIKN